MAKQLIQPTCKYGHGQMELSKDPDGSPAYFAVVHVNVQQNQLNLARGFQVCVYECLQCTYVELQNGEPPTK